VRYVLSISFAEGVGQEIKRDLPPGVISDPIAEMFTDTPVGGEAKLTVRFFTRNDFLVGQGTFGPYPNFPNTTVGSEREITIEERLVPLTNQTRYSHKRILTITNGAYEWDGRIPRPTTTVVDLNCDEESLCELDQITVNQSAAAVAYSWRATSNVPLCGEGPVDKVHRMQSISLTEHPTDALKQSDCGYTGKPLVAYELSSLVGTTPRNFYLDPSGGRFHLRAVDPSGTTPFDQTTKLSWGEFSQAMNSIAVHPAGYVVGVNSTNHRLEIVTLRSEPRMDAEAVMAVLKAGHGSRPGLLDTPIAVGVDLLSQVIIVLDSGNLRLHAFDCLGAQVHHFALHSSSTAPLRDEGGIAVTYLDMAVEGTGYIYVLSYQNAGRFVTDYRVDIYHPTGSFLSRTTGVAAARVALDRWRNLLTLNFEALHGPRGLEPSLSEWIPSAPGEGEEDA
jgi:hypothetical protein